MTTPVRSSPLFESGQGAAFLDRLFDAGSSGGVDLLQGDSPEAQYADMALALNRALLSLGLWVMPVLPAAEPLLRICPDSAGHPLRVEGFFVEHAASGDRSLEAAAGRWRQAFTGDLESFDSAVYLTEPVGSHLAMLKHILSSPEWESEGAPDYEVLLMMRSQQICLVFETAVRFLSPALGHGEARSRVRAVLVATLERHARGEAFQRPVLTQADLQMLAGSQQADVRSLAVLLSPFVAA